LATVTVPAGFKSEILVVDNGSTDGTRDVVQRRMAATPSLRYVLETSPGLSRARNAGLSQTKGEIIIFTDDDLRFPQDWLPAMCDPIIQGKCHAIAGQVKLAPHLERNWMAPRHRSWCASSERLDPMNPDDMVGASMAFARSVLSAIPSFDPELGAGVLGFGEETLFAAQLRHSGRRICLARGEPVIHHFQEDRLLRKNWLAAAVKMGRSLAYVDYHWNHYTESRMHIRFCRAIARYYLWRTLKRRECSPAEGIPLWELALLERVHRLRHYIALRNCPRNYEKYGLIKRQSS
jgi:glycosyltransferase involved in cell wall biosynthesis